MTTTHPNCGADERLTASQAGERLGYSGERIRQFVKAGELVAYRTKRPMMFKGAAINMFWEFKTKR